MVSYLAQKVTFRVPWTEIFRPKNFDEIILTRRQRMQILNWWRAWIILWNLTNYWNEHYRTAWFEYLRSREGKEFVQKYLSSWREYFKQEFARWVGEGSSSIPSSFYILFKKKSPKSKELTTDLKPTAINEIKKWLEKTWSSFISSKKIDSIPYAIPPIPPYKPILLVGPPGTGKTSSVYALAHQEGIIVVEFNASDKRSGSIIREVVREALRSSGFLTDRQYKPPRIILLDEVDGLSGKEDRGGLSALIRALDEIKLPVAFTANVMHDRKVRTLMRYSIIVFFNRPHDYQIVQLVKRIASRMKMEIPPEILNRLKYAPDFRTVVEALETYYYSGILPSLYHEEQYNIQDAIRLSFGMKSDTIEKTVFRINKYLTSVPDIDVWDIILWVWENAYNFLDHTKGIFNFYRMLAEADFLYRVGAKTLNWRIAYRDAMTLLSWAIAIYGKPVSNIWALRKIKVNKPTIVEKLGQLKRLMEGLIEEREEEEEQQPIAEVEARRLGLRPLLEAYSRHVHISRKRAMRDLKFLLYLAKQKPEKAGVLFARLYVPKETIRIFLRHYISRKDQREKIEKELFQAYENTISKVGPRAVKSAIVEAIQKAKVEEKALEVKEEEIPKEKPKKARKKKAKKKEEKPGVTLDKFF